MKRSGEAWGKNVEEKNSFIFCLNVLIVFYAKYKNLETTETNKKDG